MHEEVIFYKNYPAAKFTECSSYIAKINWQGLTSAIWIRLD